MWVRRCGCEGVGMEGWVSEVGGTIRRGTSFRVSTEIAFTFPFGVKLLNCAKSEFDALAKTTHLKKKRGKKKSKKTANKN